MKKLKKNDLVPWNGANISQVRAELLIKLAFQIENEFDNHLESWAVDYLTDDELKELTGDAKLRTIYFEIVKYSSAA